MGSFRQNFKITANEFLFGFWKRFLKKK